MAEPIGLLLPLLEHLVDGEWHSGNAVEGDFRKSGHPLNVTCGIGAWLLNLSDDGLLREEFRKSGKVNEAWYRITESGKERIDQELEARQRAAQMQRAAAPRQGSLFG